MYLTETVQARLGDVRFFAAVDEEVGENGGDDGKLTAVGDAAGLACGDSGGHVGGLVMNVTFLH